MKCRACKHSYMESDSDLICGAVNPPIGKTIYSDMEHCNGGEKFKQHPLRNTDGSLPKYGEKPDHEKALEELAAEAQKYDLGY